MRGILTLTSFAQDDGGKSKAAHYNFSVYHTAALVTRSIYYTKLPTLKALRESEDTIASVLGDFFDTFFFA